MESLVDGEPGGWRARWMERCRYNINARYLVYILMPECHTYKNGVLWMIAQKECISLLFTYTPTHTHKIITHKSIIYYTHIQAIVLMSYMYIQDVLGYTASHPSVLWLLSNFNWSWSECASDHDILYLMLYVTYSTLIPQYYTHWYQFTLTLKTTISNYKS